MNTLSPTASPTLGYPSVASATGQYHTPRRFDGARSLAALLLAAAVAALVVVADRLVNTWADGHLLAAWVFSWIVVLAGLALFAGTARRLAQRTMRGLDAWSRARALARADARLWKAAQSDPRLMGELMQAQARDLVDDLAFSNALAPMGLSPDLVEPEGSRWERFIERVGENRLRNMHLHYI
ncbi:hypothetical protein [Hydrogenophaga sp.]|uniref:hypothetical protein n=1 Tax=Hydrogenophaga sp. TaxID=1904254 RepID=UPI0025BC6484|nr:hypothetical protein [Hydrogenophaga sp.]